MAVSLVLGPSESAEAGGVLVLEASVAGETLVFGIFFLRMADSSTEDVPEEAGASAEVFKEDGDKEVEDDVWDTEEVDVCVLVVFVLVLDFCAVCTPDGIASAPSFEVREWM